MNTRYLQGVIIPFDCYSKVIRLSIHKPNILMIGFYNEMQLGKIDFLTENHEGINIALDWSNKTSYFNILHLGDVLNWGSNTKWLPYSYIG